MNIFEYPLFLIMIIAAVLSAILALVNKVLVNQGRMNEIQREMKKYNSELMKATRANDKETLDRLGKDKGKINQMQAEMMKMQMPMFASMLPFFVVFMVLKNFATDMNWGAFVNLPPLLQGGWWGTNWSWLGWYVMCSLPFSTVARKLLGVK